MFQKFFIAFILFISIHLYSENIAGIVRDAQTGEVLIGANVFIKGNKSVGTTTGLDGTFVLKNISSGKVSLVCSYISYKTIEKTIQIPTSDSQKIILDLVSYENELNDVVVTASNKTTDIGVRAIERLSSNVLNVVGARSIEISPDFTVASVLGRVSGVVMDRNSSGEAEYAVLRGMDKRYNITLVNGLKISSPNNKQRFVPLNIFPSELLDRLEVSKSRSAEIEGDATGGAVNMVMKDAPSRFTLKANLATGYNTALQNQEFSTLKSNQTTPTTPFEINGKESYATMDNFGNAFYAPTVIQPLPNIAAGISVGNRYFQKKLGIILAANYSNINKGVNTDYFSNFMPQQESTLRIDEYKKRIYSENQQQYGLHAKVDYVFSKKHSIEWYNFLVANNNTQVRYSNSVNYNGYYNPSIGNEDLSLQIRLRSYNQFVFASSLHGKHEFNKRFNLKWSTLYSRAGANRPDQSYINIDILRENFVDKVQLDGDGSIRDWEHNTDNDFTFSTHAEYNLLQKDIKLKLMAGGLFRYKFRDNFYVAYRFKPVDTNQTFETVDQINWAVLTPKAVVNPSTYKANEVIGSGYLQTKLTFSDIDIIAGTRVEHTNQGYEMAYPNAGESATGGQVYTDILPNVQVKYTPRNDMNWRAIYYRSLNRPGYFEIVPYQIQEEEYIEYGNKDLKRTLIDNVDIRWEYFPKPTDQLFIAAFYKKINSPIEFAYYSVNNRQYGYGLENLGDVQNIGLEIDFIKYIRIFGIKANYTFTHSAITTPKVYYGKDENGDTRALTANQTRPLVGQAAHVANLSLILKDVNHGWDAQLAASYIGDKIEIVSRFLDADYWEKANFQLDFSLEKSFKAGLSIFAKANNLLNSPRIRYVKTHNSYNDNFYLQNTDNTLIRKEVYRQTITIGLRYRL